MTRSSLTLSMFIFQTMKLAVSEFNVLNTVVLRPLTILDLIAVISVSKISGL